MLPDIESWLAITKEITFISLICLGPRLPPLSSLLRDVFIFSFVSNCLYDFLKETCAFTLFTKGI